ncbi:MAG: hypothetical protein ACOH2J_07005 [Allorhizobium sp.]
MVHRIVRAAVAVLLVALLSACSPFSQIPIDRPLYYDVRDVSIIADARVPEALLSRVDREVSAAIAATRRSQPLPRVVLTVKIDDFRIGTRFPFHLSHARFRMTAASVDSGNPIATGTYIVRSASNDPATVSAQLAEDIASRIRFGFALAQTPIGYPVSRSKPHQSTRLSRDIAPPAKAPKAVSSFADPEKPVVKQPVPTAAAASNAAIVEPAGTNLEAGAQSSIKLSGGAAKPLPVCDPALDAECVAPKP